MNTPKMLKLLPLLAIPVLLLAPLPVARADQVEQLERVLAATDQQIAALEYALQEETNPEKQKALRVQLAAAKDQRKGLKASLEAEVAKRAAGAARHASDLVQLRHEVNRVLARIGVETGLVAKVADPLDVRARELERNGKAAEAAKIDAWLDELQSAEDSAAEGRKRLAEIAKDEVSRGHAANVKLYHLLLAQLNEALERMRQLRTAVRPEPSEKPAPQETASAEIRASAEVLRTRAGSELSRLQSAVFMYRLVQEHLTNQKRDEEAEGILSELESITDSLAVLRKAHERLEKVLLIWAYQPDEKHDQELAEAAAGLKKALRFLWQRPSEEIAARVRREAQMADMAKRAEMVQAMIQTVGTHLEHVQARLEAEREDLAERFTNEHPRMRENEQKLARGDEHLARLERARATLKDARANWSMERFEQARRAFRDALEQAQAASLSDEPFEGTILVEGELHVESEVEIEVEDDLPFEESQPGPIDHLRQAAHHLREAGQTEAAEKIEAEIRRMELAHAHPAAVHEAIRDLRREVRELRKELREIREILLQGEDR